ncbi:Uncharacterised protein [Mycobacteroides abscessus subsp. abscessus]|nr:Uncharacterised protein [Mycobacteroides abscessus subsp. abscessus]
MALTSGVVAPMLSSALWNALRASGSSIWLARVSIESTHQTPNNNDVIYPHCG